MITGERAAQTKNNDEESKVEAIATVNEHPPFGPVSREQKARAFLVARGARRDERNAERRRTRQKRGNRGERSNRVNKDVHEPPVRMRSETEQSIEGPITIQ